MPENNNIKPNIQDITSGTIVIQNLIELHRERIKNNARTISNLQHENSTLVLELQHLQHTLSIINKGAAVTIGQQLKLVEEPILKYPSANQPQLRQANVIKALESKRGLKLTTGQIYDILNPMSNNVSPNIKAKHISLLSYVLRQLEIQKRIKKELDKTTKRVSYFYWLE
jgi:hypothetical protein